MFLKDCADIFTGLTVRGRVENDPSGECLLIQYMNVHPEKGIDFSTCHKIKTALLPSHQVLQKGDILLMAKGGKTFAYIFNEDVTAAAVSVFLIIRVTTKSVLAPWLALFLNHGSGSQQLEKKKEGTAVLNLNKSEVDNLELNVPDVMHQQRVIAIMGLWEREKQITMQMIERKNKFYSAMIDQVNTHQLVFNPNDLNDWYDIMMQSNYYRAMVKFKHPVSVKGHDKKLSEVVCTFNNLLTAPKKIEKPDGSSVQFPVADKWLFIEMSRLRDWNGVELSQQQKENEILNAVQHDEIESITLIDNSGNTIYKKAN
ncbi:MAG: restriction endonuclease subunit S [Bacteroidetes bacterium]|nr:restriction endonuclease subunit S [Bacteroidota bacterium]